MSNAPTFVRSLSFQRFLEDREFRAALASASRVLKLYESTSSNISGNSHISDSDSGHIDWRGEVQAGEFLGRNEGGQRQFIASQGTLERFEAAISVQSVNGKGVKLDPYDLTGPKEGTREEPIEVED